MTSRQYTQVWHALFAFAVPLSLLSVLQMSAQANGASSLPATAPTTSISPSQLPSANPPVAPVSRGHANISWDGSTLQISATNVGLNRLLRDIAAKTGLRITGSAPDERIFGTYGPGKIDDVLSDLLDGVAVNMLYIDHLGEKPKELVLTSRAGGATPPTQSAETDSGEEAISPDQNERPQRPESQPGQSVRGTAVPTDPTASGTTQPSGVRTPQEIFEQLQRLRSQANSH